MKNTLVVAILVIVLGAGAFWLYSNRESDTPEDGGALGGEVASNLSTTTSAYEVQVAALPGNETGGDAVAAFIRAERARFIADAQGAYDEYLIELPPYPWRPYALAIEYERTASTGYISYLVDEYVYTGGANGTQLVRSFNYGPDGTPITLADVIPAEKRSALLVELKSKLNEMNGTEGTGGDTFAGAIAELTFEDLEHFVLTDSEIVIAFQEYDVAPGAAGAVKVSLSRSTYSAI